MVAARPAAVETEDAALVRRWIDDLNQADAAMETWRSRATDISKRYRKATSTRVRKFSLLWSITQTLLPAVFARVPEPVVSRRFKDDDPVARAASEVLERAAAYSLDTQDFENVLQNSVLDYVLLARGQAWERYVPHLGEEVTPQIQLSAVAMEGAEGERYEDDDGEAYDPESVQFDDEGRPYALGEPYQPVEWEEAVTDYVNWSDFGHSVARTWDEVWFVYRRAYMTRKALIKRFGEEKGKACPLDWGSRTGGDRSDARNTGKERAAVYEIWCKETRKVYWICKAYGDGPLDVRDDPLHLDGFFPCPRPMFGTTANDGLDPTPEYLQYQDQAQEIDDLTVRIGELETALKVRGFYPSWLNTDLNALFTTKNNFLLPIQENEALRAEGGMKGAIEWFPVDQVIQVLKAAIELRQQLLNDVYEITGISDILRGASDPRETATAVGKKAQWGSIRVRDRQKEIARFARDVVRIKCEVIAEHFEPETLAAMTGVKLPRQAEKEELQAQIQFAVQQAQQTGQEPPPIPDEMQAVLSSPTWEDVVGLLRNNALRQFRIDIETDSTIEANELEEKGLATEFIQAVTGMFAQMGPAVEKYPQLAELAGALMQYGVRRFRAGRELEAVIDRSMQKISASLAAPQAGAQAGAPPPDDTPVKVAEIEHATEQVKQQGELQRAQINASVKGSEQQLKLVAMQRDPIPQVTA